MATASTGWKCTHGASIVASTNTTVTIRVTCYWTNQSWNYNINNVSAWVYCNGSSYQVKSNGSVNAPSNSGSYSMGYHDFVINKGTSSANISCYAKITSNSSYVAGTKSSSATSISVPAKPSYTISYNANGGSGAPGNQTKWYGTNIVLSSSIPSRTGYSFAGWATSASGAVVYNAGSTYSTDANITLYAKWNPYTYTVSYNANGGSGAPGNQTKTYGVNLTLSSTKPTRTNYNFLGWATSASGGVAYSSGAIYTANAGVTLYAVWQLAYKAPRISGFAVNRCNSAGTASESGTYARATFTWSTDRSVSSIVIQYRTISSTSWSNVTVSASGTSGNVNTVFGSNAISAETSYIVRCYASDSGGTTYSTEITLGTIKYPIDIKKGGTSVAFGKVAEADSVVDIGTWDIRHKNVNLNVGKAMIFDGYENGKIKFHTID